MKPLLFKLTVNVDDGKHGFTHEYRVDQPLLDKVGFDQAVGLMEQELVAKFRKYISTLKPRCTGNYGHLSAIRKE